MFNYQKIANDCIKCGKCIPVCTIHQIHPDETTSPRGFIDLLSAYDKGKLPLDHNAKHIFETCFLCTNCVDVCPNALPTDGIIEQVRHEIAQKYGISWFKRLFFMLLRHRWLNDLLFKIGYIFTPCGFQTFKERESMLFRIPEMTLPIVGKNRLLPSMHFTSFLNKYPDFIPASGRQKVAIFIGCLANYNYTTIGDALIDILKTLEIDVYIPKKQLCCGAPAYFTGDFDTADYLIKKNITYFETFIDSVDAILIPEATCSAMIKSDWNHILEDQPAWKSRASRIIPKVFLATEWLHKHSRLQAVLETNNVKRNSSVTYHDPCHARKVQGVFQEPRDLLRNNYSMIEMEDPNRCCGFGGVTMQTEKYAYALKAGIPKAHMIQNSGATIVSAECSACRMQLSNALHHCKIDTVFKHPLELISEALTKA
jgi:glycolate oxidase iron-sulfur subunit